MAAPPLQAVLYFECRPLERCQCFLSLFVPFVSFGVSGRLCFVIATFPMYLCMQQYLSVVWYTVQGGRLRTNQQCAEAT